MLIEKGQATQFQKNLISVFKFLFKRKCEKAQSKLKVNDIDEVKLKVYADKYMKKIYEEVVSAYRKKMFDLMMNDQPLVEDEPFNYLDQEEEKIDDANSTNKLGQETSKIVPS